MQMTLDLEFLLKILLHSIDQVGLFPRRRATMRSQEILQHGHRELYGASEMRARSQRNQSCFPWLWT